MIGMMEQHFVRDEKSIPEEDFKRYVAAAKLFPGPIATLIAIRIGFEKAGRKGGIVAGLCQVLPAFFMILLISHFLVDAKSNSNGVFSRIFTGLEFGGLALSVVAAIRFSKPLLSTQTTFYMFGTAALVYFYPQEEIFFLLACGILSLLYQRFKNHIFEASSLLLAPLFLESFKASLFTYGTGIAIVPVLKAVYIDRYHWVSQSDFLTALSVGQITPGPLIIFNTYLAKQIAGTPGAICATTGIFLPTFIFGLVLMPLFEKRMLNTPWLKVFFAGMLPAVGGAILGSVARLMIFAVQEQNGEFSWNHILLVTILIAVSLKSKFHPIFIIVLGAILAVLASLL